MLVFQIDGQLYHNRVTAISIDAEAVVKEQIPVIKEKVLEVLNGIANGDEEVDMERLVQVIHKSILEDMNSVSSSSLASESRSVRFYCVVSLGVITEVYSMDVKSRFVKYLPWWAKKNEIHAAFILLSLLKILILHD